MIIKLYQCRIPPVMWKIVQHAQDLRDVLRNASGVQTRNISGGVTDAFVLRGFEVQNILQDGLQLDRNSHRIHTENIERVEVVKGANALLTGQSQPGGTINIVTKRPQADSRHVLVSAFDEFGQKELMFDSTGKLTTDDSLLYRVVASVNESETFRKTDKKAEISRHLFAPSLTWNINDANSLTASMEYISSELPIDEGTVAIENSNGDLVIADIDRSVRLCEDEDISDTNQLTANPHFSPVRKFGYFL